MVTQVLCMQINAEKSPYLVEKLKIWMLPTLALIRQEKTVDYVVGFDDLGGKDDFTTEVIMAASLARCSGDASLLRTSHHAVSSVVRSSVYAVCRNICDAWHLPCWL